VTTPTESWRRSLRLWVERFGEAQRHIRDLEAELAERDVVIAAQQEYLAILTSLLTPDQITEFEERVVDASQPIQ
jgi:DNA-binding PadR family transcriptional regulator